MAGYVAKVNSMPVAQTLYGTCATAAATVAKVVTCADYDRLNPNSIICVYMQYTNTAASPTLNVNSKGAKPIYRYGTTVPGTTAATSWEAGTMVLFKYDTTLNTGGCYVMVSYRTDNNTNTTYSAGTGLSLSSTTFSLGTSGVTAGSYGPSANASPAHSGTFSVPYITVDTYGRVTAASTKTITLPSDNNTDIRPSAYCDTAAATAAKVASCTGYALTANTYLHVVIVNANSYNGAITLNVNGKGAKPIYINGAASSSSNKTLPAGSYICYYNGTNYYFETGGQPAGPAITWGTLKNLT